MSLKQPSLNMLIFCLLLSVQQNIYAQVYITGTIQDAVTQETLMGATVKIKETSIGTSSNENGYFKLDLNGHTSGVLVFTYLGYDKKEVAFNGSQKLTIMLQPTQNELNEITVTARRRDEEVQQIPITVSVIGGKELANTQSFNVARVKELVPSVQLYSSNPRNTTLNIRGLGSTFGLTNDGIDPGVGFYVDGVYFARAAATSLDFIDVSQIEVLRGPQGTLFGKNTTAGAFNISTLKPTFNWTAQLEQTLGNYSFNQSKFTFSGPIWKDKLALRISYSGTQRAGNVYNIRTQSHTNSLNNQGLRAQLLFRVNSKYQIRLAADYTNQQPEGYAQVYAGSVRTLRPDFRQFDQIISDLNYQLPSTNPFDRLIDHDVPWKSNQELAGAAIYQDYQTKRGTITSISAWRYWNWQPSNDRDFTGMQALTLSQAPSIHHQASQEIRYAGKLGNRFNLLAGTFLFYQDLKASGAHVEESGKDQWRLVQNNNNPLWQTPGLLDGYGIRSQPNFNNTSIAAFSQLDAEITSKWTAGVGIRLNYDRKSVNFKRETYGGLQTTDPQLLALKNAVYSNQTFQANISDQNFSGVLLTKYNLNNRLRIYANASLAYKPVGLNLGGLPTEQGRPMTELAVVRPERVYHTEIGLKSEPIKNTQLNLSFYHTDLFDYQTNVVVADLGVNRGYLANAPHVNVKGIEVDLSYRISKKLNVFFSGAYTDGKYIDFKNAPVPLEETGGEAYKDISGGQLPGISKFSYSARAEYTWGINLLGLDGRMFVSGDAFYRSSFSSSPSPSKYLNISAYTLVNARLGFTAQNGVTLLAWSRNITNVNYFEMLLAGAGNVGHFAAVLGDPPTFGFTIRYDLSSLK